MLETAIATLSPMLVLFLCMVIGFVLKKKQLIPDNADVVISRLETTVLVPALSINNFMTYCTVASIRECYIIVLYSLFALIVALLIGIPLSRLFAKKGEYQRNVYKYALTFSNFGFMGNSVVLAILGAQNPEALYQYLLFTLPLSAVVSTWGLMILIPQREDGQNPLKNLFNPTFVGIFIGMILGLTGAKAYLPSFILRVIDDCQKCMGPLAMILTGFVIGGYPFKEMLSNKKVYVATGLRLIVLPAIILTILKLAGAPNLVMTLALFAYATPLGLNTVVYPAAYGGDFKTGASMAMISHTLCVLTIPVMYAILTTIL